MVRPEPIVLGKLGRGQHLDHSIHLAWHEGFMEDGFDFNECIDHLTEGRADIDWRGPLLLFGMGKTMESSRCRNLYASDLTIALNAIEHFRGDLRSMNMRPTKKIQAVKVNSSPPFFEEVQVSLQHPIFSVGAKSTISEQFLVPLRTYLSGNAVSPKATAEDGAAPNPASYLHTIIDPRDPYCTSISDVGKVPEGWLNNTRSIVLVTHGPVEPALTQVMGLRGLVLSAKMVHILCIFARQESEALRKANTSSEAVQEYVEKQLTKEKYLGNIVKQKEYEEMWDEEIASELESMGLGADF